MLIGRLTTFKINCLNYMVINAFIMFEELSEYIKPVTWMFDYI